MNRRLANALFLLSAILVVWTFVLPRIPQQGQHRDGAFQAFVTVFFIHWAVLSIVSASSLWRAGRAQPTVARRRMQFALASLTDPALDVLITGETSFESLPEVMAALADGSRDALCHRVRYE